MTYRQEAEKNEPWRIGSEFVGGVKGCPGGLHACTCEKGGEKACRACLDREIPGTEPLGKWKIVTFFYDHNFKPIGCETYSRYYKHKSSASRRAKQLWGLNPFVAWTVRPTEGER